jgi:hypothetical protein
VIRSFDSLSFESLLGLKGEESLRFLRTSLQVLEKAAALSYECSSHG